MELFSRVSGLDTTPAVILLHGLFGASDNLSNLARTLADHFHVHVLDARNHGRSPHTDEMGYAAMAQDVVDYLDTHDIDSAHIFGHSMGGKTAMELALSRPERIQKLLVADIAPVDYPAHHEQIFKAFAAIELSGIQQRSEVEQEFSRFIEDSAVRQFLLKSLIRDTNGKFKWRFNLEVIFKDYQNILAAPPSTGPFYGPVLFISGSESDYVLPQHRDNILSLFPKAKSKLIQGVGHWLHAEKPTIFNNLCLRFLEHS